MKRVYAGALVVALFFLCSSEDIALSLVSLVVFAGAAWGWVTWPAESR